MLRKKLSKLILGGLMFSMVAGVTTVTGQAVMAQEVQAGAETTQVANGTANVTTNADLSNALKDSKVTTINLKVGVTLTNDVLIELNDRLKLGNLTIIVGNGASITIPEGVTLDGLNKLTIVRDAANTGSAVKFEKSQQSGQIQTTIQNVIFKDQSESTTSGVIDTTNISGTVNVTNNTIDGGSLFTTDPSKTTNVKESGTKAFNGGKVFVGQTVVTETIVLDPVQVTGVDAKITGTTTANKDVALTVSDEAGTVVKNTTVKSDAKGKFTFDVTGLTKNTNYNVTVQIKDQNGQVVEVKATFKTGDVAQTVTIKSTVSNVTTNTATITVDRAGFAEELKVVVVSGNTKVTVTIPTTGKDAVITGLNSGTDYKYDVTDVRGNILTSGTFRTLSETISGGSGSSAGSSTVSTDISSNDMKKATIKDVTATIPVSNTSLSNSLKSGKDFKTNINGVTVEFVNGHIELKGLVPGKDYKNLTITYTDRDNRTKNVRVPRFTTAVAETKIRQFIVDVYKNSLNRVPDETGFKYWEDKLTSKAITPEEFVKNLLHEKEFIDTHPTTKDKIEGLYMVIVNRASDATGLKYWTDKYDKLVSMGYSDQMALSLIIDEMVNEQEFKNRVKDLGL